MAWLVATRKGLFELDEDGAVTAVHFRGAPVTAVVPTDDGLVVALRHGHYGPKVHRRTDEGWTELTAPAFPQDGDESVDQIWVLDAAADGTIWAGTLPAGLFSSTDGGETWTLCRALHDRPERKKWFGGGFDAAGVHSIVPDAHGPGSLVLGISCGGVWHSPDRGETWTLWGEGLTATYMPPNRATDLNIQDPHRVRMCPADPSRLWMQHHNGVYRSDDGGRTWTELDPPPTGFGFPVAAHPTDPDTAWLIPAESAESRLPLDGAVIAVKTTDGGESWTVQREGLPQEHAYDLVFRHALDIDDTGDRLAFGSTTGSLWLTRDGGDHWTCANAHLPPVYAVRWTEAKR